MKRAVVALSAVMMTACSEESSVPGPLDECTPSAWLTFPAVPDGEDDPQGDTVSPVEGDGPGTVLLVRVGPFEEERQIDAIQITMTRACDMPDRLSVGAWPSAGALPSGDPRQHLAACDVEVTPEAATAQLPEPVIVPAGSFGWVARDLDGSCNAIGPEIEGVDSLLWRPDGSGWQLTDGQAMMSPVSCDETTALRPVR